MALRVCRRIIRDSAVLSRRLVVSTRQEPAQLLLATGNSSCSCGRINSLTFNPACFITTDAFVSSLLKGNTAEADNSCFRLPSSVPSNSGEQMSLLTKHPDQPEDSKVLKVAIIGAPNAGKSTLSNQILGRKVFAVSKKVHTTRKRALGVLTEGDTQIILLDTPGLTTPSKVKRHQLEKSLLLDPWRSVTEADLMVVMVDVSDRWMSRQLDFEVLKCLARHPNIPAILVLNKVFSFRLLSLHPFHYLLSLKVDQVKMKDKLLDVTAELTCGVVNGRKLRIRPVIKPPWAEKMPERDLEEPQDQDAADGDESVLTKEQLRTLMSQKGWSHFKDVFMLSSLDRADVETLKDYLMITAKSGAWQYHSEVLTDQRPEEMCINMIREKLLEHLPQEVPYAITQFIDFWDMDENGELNIMVKIYTKKETHMRMLIGTSGQMIARVAQETSEQLTSIFLRQVKLKLSVKMKK